MLERTAASLEPCHLQRVLTSLPKRSSDPCRQLQTGFWQHGASAIELFSHWPRAAHPIHADASVPSPTSHSTPMTLASSCLYLDFLYPRAAYSCLLRARSKVQQTRNGAGKLRQAEDQPLRGFTSSAVGVEHAPQIHALTSDSITTLANRRAPISFANNNNVISDCEDAPRALPLRRPSPSSSVYPTLPKSTHKGPLSKSARTAGSRLVEDIFIRPPQNDRSNIWELYRKSNKTHLQILQRAVVIFLSRSRSADDRARAITLFYQLDPNTWDDELQSAGILALVLNGHRDSAINRFIIGLEAKGLTGGLEYLLISLIRDQNWAALGTVWLEVFSSLSDLHSGIGVDDLKFPQLETIPDMGRLFLLFEAHLEVEESRFTDRSELHAAAWKSAMQSLRQKMAKASLIQSCPLKQAEAILGICADAHLYESFLSRMLTRWTQGLETREGLVMLPEIYRQYRTLPYTKPPVPLLHAMFDYYFPTDAPGLDGLYRDWHTTWKYLDQLGYEKFLKFYSRKGDVQSVKQLWAEYISRYPGVLDSPRAFRSTINVHAQAGDVVRTEEQIRIMTDTYGVAPDLDTWNTLLKCYARADDLKCVLRCFEEIRAIHQPDSFTYAHVMALAAKKGDLETVLDFLKKSQENKVPISREMSMALVLAYCRNDLLEEAEKVCLELAQRRVTSSGVWNQLLYFNAAQGNLAKCHELLQGMKSFAVEWDSQTHEVLLRALVQVGQIQPAFRLLRRAYDEKLYPVSPSHVAVVMSGAIRSNELAVVETLLSMMERQKQAITFNVQVPIVEAAFRKSPSAMRTRKLGRQLVHLLRSMVPAPEKTANAHVEAFHGSEGDNSKDVASAPLGDAVDLRARTRGIGRAAMLLVQLRDFAAAEELATVYSQLFPDCKRNDAFPPELAGALMLAYLNDGKLAQLHRMWERTWASVLERSRHHRGHGIYPAHQYDLSRPMSIMVRAYRNANDGHGLLKCLQMVTGAGFRLTRSTWNLAVRHLADMGQWERAADWCETLLMPRWQGWGLAKKKSLQERRKLRSTRVLEASRETVLSLQKHWLKLRKLAAWSGEVSNQLMDFERTHPKLLHAFITTDFEHLRGTWVLPRKQTLKSAVGQLIKPLSLAELRIMQRALERQLRWVEELSAHGHRQRRHHRRPVPGYGYVDSGSPSPFHVVTGRSEEEIHTDACQGAALRLLDAALRRRLDEKASVRAQTAPVTDGDG